MPQKWSKALYLAQTTTVRVVKAGAGTLGGYYVYNPNNSVAYVQLFDESGTVTLGSTVPALSLGVPAQGAANLEFADGVRFPNGIQLAVATTATGSSAPGTGLDVNIYFR